MQQLLFEHFCEGSLGTLSTDNKEVVCISSCEKTVNSERLSAAFMWP